MNTRNENNRLAVENEAVQKGESSVIPKMMY